MSAELDEIRLAVDVVAGLAERDRVEVARACSVVAGLAAADHAIAEAELAKLREEARQGLAVVRKLVDQDRASDPKRAMRVLGQLAAIDQGRRDGRARIEERTAVHAERFAARAARLKE